MTRLAVTTILRWVENIKSIGKLENKTGAWWSSVFEQMVQSAS